LRPTYARGIKGAPRRGGWTRDGTTPRFSFAIGGKSLRAGIALRRRRYAKIETPPTGPQTGLHGFMRGRIRGAVGRIDCLPMLALGRLQTGLCDFVRDAGRGWGGRIAGQTKPKAKARRAGRAAAWVGQDGPLPTGRTPRHCADIPPRRETGRKAGPWLWHRGIPPLWRCPCAHSASRNLSAEKSAISLATTRPYCGNRPA